MTQTTKVRTTKTVRMNIDLELVSPRDALSLKDLAGVIEDVLRGLISVRTAQVTQIIPAEPNFDWQGQ